MVKRAQIELSFGMIFSIILIIVFLGFAFFAIKKLLDTQCSVQVGKFNDDLQGEVNRIWQGSQGSQEFQATLPKKIKAVCFIDEELPEKGKNSELYEPLRKEFYNEENIVFYPIGSACGIDAKVLKNIDIKKTTEDENPFCVSSNGKVKMLIKMNSGERLVTISK